MFKMSQFRKLTQITPVKIKELNPEHFFIFFHHVPSLFAAQASVPWKV